MIVRAPSRNRWVCVDNKAVEDNRLSLGAKGLLVYLLSRPDNWRASPEQIAQTTSDSVYAIRNFLRELRKFGYAKLRTLGSGGRGNIAGTEWIISEESFRDEGLSNLESIETRNFRNSENRQLTNTDKRISTEKETKNVNGSLFPEIKRVGKRPTLMELKAYCSEKGLSPRDAEWLDAKWEGNGFKNNGKPITSWRGTISQWEIQKIFPSQKDKPFGGNQI